MIIVANEEHRFLALDQLRDLRDVQATLLLEPSGGNTPFVSSLKKVSKNSVSRCNTQG
jgi:hypothetical protein